MCVTDGTCMPAELGEYIETIPPMKRVSEDWYQGTADAVFQNFQSIEAEGPQHTLLLAADHIYKMNYRDMLDWHRRHGADITIATIQMEPEQADRFGVAEIDSDYRVVGFEEKPKHGNPKRSRFDPSMVSASMGIYLFETDVLLKALHEDAREAESSHDFGKDVIPRNLDKLRVVAYDFRDINAKRVRYWRDVGTLDAYYEANMDLVSVEPGVQPVRPQLGDPHEGDPATAGQVRLRPGRAAHGHRAGFHRLGGMHRFGRARGAQHPVAGGAGEQLLRSGIFDSDARRGDRTVQPHPPGDREYQPQGGRLRGDRFRRRCGSGERLYGDRQRSGGGGVAA